MKKVKEASAAESSALRVKIQKVSDHAVIPTYATDGSGAFDLYWSAPADYATNAGPGSPALLATGLAFEVPEGHVMLVFSRSGHGFSRGVRLANCVGVIDSDYRGEVMVKLAGDGPGRMTFYGGDRIAQALIVPVPRVEFEAVDALSETQRGEAGFGSTGN